MNDWQARLGELARAYDVVGASLAVQHGDQVGTAVTGVLNIRTGQPVTPDSVFQVGSITKVWTATQVMQLVDAGRLDLDAPVRDYLPSFSVADEAVSATVTSRHLLCHSSGIDGDLFLDTGRGDDAVARYVEAMVGLGQNHPLGTVFSYCNAGFIVLTHLVSVLRETTWESALRADLIEPLGAAHAGTLPEEAVLQSVAAGHYWDASSASPVVTHQWGLFRSVGGSGLLHSTPKEQLAFARLHLNGGRAADGRQILRETSVAAMQSRQIDVPDPTQGTGWGLGWALDDWGGARVFGHDGETGSQSSFLAVLPEDDLAIALCTNGGRDTKDLWTALSGEIAASVGITRRPSPRPSTPPVPVDIGLVEGTYRRAGFDAVVAPAGAGLELRVTARGALVGLVPDHVLELVGYDGDGILLGRVPGEDDWRPVVFFELDGERYMHAGGLAFRRVF